MFTWEKEKRVRDMWYIVDFEDRNPKVIVVSHHKLDAHIWVVDSPAKLERKHLAYLSEKRVLYATITWKNNVSILDVLDF